ncbi:MAG: family 43 glycosylhydrolase [Spirochaetales bacterium]|nr:family 43 glycosylhydrolase [Spirochaetales bacterium]
MGNKTILFASLACLLALTAGCATGGTGASTEKPAPEPAPKPKPAAMTLRPLYDSFFTRGNPIISQKYTADPTICVFNKRVYVYMSHDLDKQTDYQINDTTIISSDDLANWTDHLEPFKVPECASWARFAYAPTTVYRNKKYYLYFGNGGGGIGVATSDTPTGPWSDPRGSVLVSPATPGADVKWCFDPAVFIDDDGQAYMYFGGGGPGNSRVIKLNKDMISVDGPAREIQAPPDRFFEALYMNKRKGIYYLTYSSDFSKGPARIEYMMSTNPMTGFVYKGVVFDNPPYNQNNNNHASIVEYKGEWYLAYHNRAQAILDYANSGYAAYHRSVCLDKIEFNPDGTIKKVMPTLQGVPQLKYLNPYAVNQAETMHRQYGIKTKEFADGIIAVTDVDGGDIVKYKGVDFGKGGARALEARVSGAAGGVIEVYLDLTAEGGEPVGSIAVASTGGDETWTAVSGSLGAKVTGVHDVYLKFKGDGKSLFNLDWWRFKK